MAHNCTIKILVALFFLMLLPGISIDQIDSFDTPDYWNPNHSYSGGAVHVQARPPKAIVLKQGYWNEMAQLCEGITFDRYNRPRILLQLARVMIIPTGALAAVSKDTALKAVINRYVSQGGRLIVMSQPFGVLVSEFVPLGDKITALGYREEPSHYGRSTFRKRARNVCVDGYFTRYPKGAVILMARRNNDQVDLLHYPFGKGTVYLTSMLTDRVSAEHMISPDESHLFKELLEMASKPTEEDKGDSLCIRGDDEPNKIRPSALNVNASFEHLFYDVGDMANLKVDLTDTSSFPTQLDLVVTNGHFYKKVPLKLLGRKRIAIPIPANGTENECPNLRIYDVDGKCLFQKGYKLRTRTKGYLLAQLDRESYNAGDTIKATFTSRIPGSIHVLDHRLNINRTQPFDGVTVQEFKVPVNASAGDEYDICWRFTPDDTGIDPFEGSLPLKVGDIEVKITKCMLESTDYRPSDIVRAEIVMESNRDRELKLAYSFNDGRGYTHEKRVGIQAINLSASQQNHVSISFPLKTCKAGYKELVVKVLEGEGECGCSILAQKSIAFQVAGAEVLIVRTDRLKYTEDTRQIHHSALCFGFGAVEATWRTGHKTTIKKHEIVNGLTELTCTVPPDIGHVGRSLSELTITQNGLSSKGDTSYYCRGPGPDLFVDWTLIKQDGNEFLFDLCIGNCGTLPAPPSKVIVKDNETVIWTMRVPALEMDQKINVPFTWDMLGKPGKHLLSCFIDPENKIEELDGHKYDNRQFLRLGELVEEQGIAEVDVKVESDSAIWNSDSEHSAQTVLTNNLHRNVSIQLETSITDYETGAVKLNKSQTINLSPLEIKTLPIPFDYDRSLYALYTITCKVAYLDQETSSTREVIVYPLPQKKERL